VENEVRHTLLGQHPKSRSSRFQPDLRENTAKQIASNPNQTHPQIVSSAEGSAN
jgi:hypothetical protein